MMDKMISLIKTDLNITFGLSALKYKLKNKRDRWQFIILIFALISIVPTYIVMVNGLLKLYDAYNTIGQQSMFLLNGFISSQLLVFLFGIIFVMAKYYFSNDLNVLVPLPIKPGDIIGAKFITSVVNEYLTSLPIILPFIFIFGIKAQVGIAYWIYSLILVAFLPIIPLALSSIIVMILMKYTNIKGRKDLFRIVGYFILIIVILAFQFKIQSITQKSLIGGEDFFLKMVQDSNLLVRKLGLSFPPSMWGALALSNYFNIAGFLNFILFVGVSIGVFLLMIFLGERIFFDGLIGSLEVSVSHGKKGKKIELDESIKLSPPFVAIGLKEIKMLIRTPVYLFNSVVGVVILPIIMVISTFMNGRESLGELSVFIEGKSYMITLFGIGLVTAYGVMNCVGCTTFSREGKSFWIQRTMPIKVKDQIFGRILSSLFVQAIGIIALIGSIAFISKVTLENVLWIILLGLLGSIPMTELGMIVDIFRPLLDWDNPQKAMKQNLNVLISMGIGVLYVFAVGFLAYKMLMSGFNILGIYGIIGLIFILSSYIFYIPLKNLIKRQFEMLE